MRLLLWCLGGGALVQLLLWRWSDFERFTPIFRYLLRFYDAHGNLLLIAIIACAYFLRRQPAALSSVRFAADRPWTLAAALLPVFCLASIRIYHAYPLSMDESSAIFQAEVFAAGRLAGAFPPDLLDRLIPPYFHNTFLVMSRASGEVSATFWPGFSLLLAPFVWLHIPWALNPVLGALAIPALHRLVRQVTGSQEAAGWAVALAVASPAFVLASISFYSTQAHLLANLLYALLLLQPAPGRAFLAGLVGSLALTLHQPVPHLLFMLPFVAWLALRGGSIGALGALVAGYLPLSLLLGVGWQLHLAELARGTPSAAGLPIADMVAARVGNVLSLPGALTIDTRLAGLSKAWTWAAPGLIVLAVYGYLANRVSTAVRVIGGALALTVLGYFFFRVEQGHGWGYRYLHSAWFVLPLFAAMAVAAPGNAGRGEMRAMVAWAIVLSMVLANGQRLVQVESFIDAHLKQVPPLAQPPDPGRRELVFVNPAGGSYLEDMVQNDPMLRSTRIVMTTEGREGTAEFVQRRFPGFVRTAQGPWGELWTAPRGN